MQNKKIIMKLDNVLSICQNGVSLILCKMKPKELIENTYVAFHNTSNNTGYQRALQSAHYRKIVKFLRNNDKPFMLSSYILAINKDEFSLNGAEFIVHNRMRLVDGQHRVEAFKELREVDIVKFNEIKDFEYPITILITEKNDDINEILSFIDINSKGKKVNTNLAITLRDKLYKENNSSNLSFEEFKERICTNVIINLNNSAESVWYELIKIGNETGREKKIGINAFNESLKPVISSFLMSLKIDISNYSNYLTNLDKYSNELTELVDECWSLVSKKWSVCFKYTEKYNIQKGVGVFPFHIILSQSISKNEGDTDNNLQYFLDTIEKSEIDNDSWIVGGDFSYYNSKSGFLKVVKMIQNEFDDSLI